MSFTYFTPGACENLFSRGSPNSQWRQEKVLVAGSSQPRTVMQDKGEESLSDALLSLSIDGMGVSQRAQPEGCDF